MTTNGKVLVTGATGVLGKAIATYLSERCWEVVVTSRDIDRALDLANDLDHDGCTVTGIDLDLLDPDSVQSLPERLAERDLSITHLVHNARTLDALHVGEDGTSSAADFRDELEVDVVQPYRLTMEMARSPHHALRAVVHIGSQYGLVAPNPTLYGGNLSGSPVQYGTAKAALHHLTRELSVRLSPSVRVNCVAFGGFAGRADSDFMARYGHMVPSGRMLDPSEAGGPVAFLLGEASTAVNGHVLVADGGWTVW